MTSRHPLLRRAALCRLALATAFAMLASGLAQAQVLAPPANKMGSLNYSATAVPDTGGLWNPVWAAQQMQGAFDYEANYTATAVAAVNNAMASTTNIQNYANNSLNAAVDSYNNSVAVYNVVNNVNGNVSNNVSIAQNAYSSSAGSSSYAQTAYNIVASTPPRKSTVPHLVKTFSGTCGAATVYYTDGTTQSVGDIC